MMVLGACSATQPPDSPDVVKPPELKAIQSISTVQETDQFKVAVGSNRLLTYTSVKKPSPLSVVLYFPETVIDGAVTDMVIDSDVVSFVSASAISTEGQASRIEIGLKRDAPYEVIRGESGLSIVFNTPAGQKALETAVRTGAEPAPPALVASQPVIVAAGETTTEEMPAVVQASQESSATEVGQDAMTSAADSPSTAESVFRPGLGQQNRFRQRRSRKIDGYHWNDTPGDLHHQEKNRHMDSTAIEQYQSARLSKTSFGNYSF